VGRSYFALLRLFFHVSFEFFSVVVVVVAVLCVTACVVVVMRLIIMTIHQVRVGSTREPSLWLAEQQRASYHIPARQALERSESVS
jgi:hypothetical protein